MSASRKTQTHPIFTAAMRDHELIVARAERKATAIYTACFLCSAAVLATAILVAATLL